MKDEDESSLKAVDDGEDVGKHDGLLVDEGQTKRPRQTQQDLQYQCTFYPRPKHEIIGLKSAAEVI